MKQSKPKQVKVTTLADESGNIRYFRVEGHAGFAAAGQDIVCAAISVLTVTAVNGLETYLSVAPVYSSEDGFLECSINHLESEQDSLTAKAILGTMMLGLKQVQSIYGSRYIMIEQGRWTPC